MSDPLASILGPPPPPPPDVADALVDALRYRGLGKPAALVEHMASRRSSAFEDVAHAVIGGDRPVPDDTMRKLVGRTNRALGTLAPAIGLRVACGRVYWR